MACCQESHFGTCFGTEFCHCGTCGIVLCRQHSYFNRGNYLCFHCYVAEEYSAPMEVCCVCGESSDKVSLDICECCGRYVCENCMVLYPIELKSPGDDLDDFDGAGNDVRRWCPFCVDKWEHPLLKPAFP